MGCLVGSLRRYLVLAWLVVSIGMMISGCEETRIAWRCTAQPVEVPVEQLESGYRPATDYITIGEHIALVDGGVYEYKIKKGHENDPVSDATPIDKLYYPVFSKSHPLAQGEDPAKAAWFKVLVETTRYKTVGQVRLAQPEGSSLVMGPTTGVVINQIDPLTAEERRLLREGFPLLALESVTVIEEGREPKSRAAALGILLAGGLLFVGPPLLYVLWSRRNAPPPLATNASLGAPGPYVPAGPARYSGAPPASPSGPPPPSAAWPAAPGGSLPPTYGSAPPGGSASLPPGSARFAPGARVCVTRNDASHYGSVLKAQQGQVYVELDDGRKVWVAQQLVTLA